MSTARPQSSYLVCANQRSGTHVLCDALTDTGVAGTPEEYFLAVDESVPSAWSAAWEKGPYGRKHGAADRESYLDLVYRLGSTPNGVFGAKMMWNNVKWAVAKFHQMPRFAVLTRAEVFHEAFPGLRVINVTRRDRVRQAVSWARIAKGGPYVVRADRPAPPVAEEPEYDFALIHALEGLIVEGERGWRELFAELGLAPFDVVYEDLVSTDGYERTIRGVLDHLEVEIPADVALAPRTMKQSDEINEDWVARYTAERTRR